MVTNSAEYVSEVTGSADPCEILVEDDQHLGRYTTTRSLLNTLKGKLQKEQEVNPSWLSTNKLKEDLESLEVEYSLISVTVKAYKDGYEGIKTQLKGYKDYENKLNSQTNDIEYQGIRKAIDDLWKKNYSENEILNQYEQAWKSFKNIKTCLEKAEVDVSTTPPASTAPAAAGTTPPASTTPAAASATPDPAVKLIPDKKIRGAKEEFFYYKNYKEKVKDISTVLDALKVEIDKVDDGEIRKKYAYYLVFKGVLDNIRSLAPDDYEQQKPVLGKYPKKEPAKPVKDDQWLKNQLTKKFIEWVYSVYKYFYWNKDSIAKNGAVDKAWKKYEEFITNRKMQFISEAEEIESSDSAGEC